MGWKVIKERKHAIRIIEKFNSKYPKYLSDLLAHTLIM